MTLPAILCLVAVSAVSPAAAQSTVSISLTGLVLDPTGATVPRASVTLTTADTRESTVTDDEGRFALRGDPRGGSLAVAATGFEAVVVPLPAGQHEVRLTLRPSAVRERVTVQADAATTVTTGTRFPTPLRDVPQAVSVVTAHDARDLGMQGLPDVMRYVPGAGVAQGESNRDAIVLRGVTSTGDFFVDGVRDDAQYFRDLYNVDRVEVLKGPNAMMFGRGGVAGVINRVTKQPEWTARRELSLQGGSWANRRLTADIGDRAGGSAAYRVTGVFEDSDSYRHGATLERQGITPSLALALGGRTMLRASVEYFHDRRTADRGIPSLEGRPVETSASTFFGNADASYANATVNVASVSLDRMFGDEVEFRNRTQLAAYDKFYQNVFAGRVEGVARTVSISAYNHATNRGNVFNQSDLLWTHRTGKVLHRLATGMEVGRQSSDSVRNTGFFASGTSYGTTVTAPLDAPAVAPPTEFHPAAGDANARSTAIVASAYLQDMLQVARFADVVAGLRYDRFQVAATNNRTGDRYGSGDGLLSPRVAVVVKPREALSLYSSYTVAYQPRAGEQLTSLSLTNRALKPETFRNREVGVKWDVRRALSLTAAAYRLTRGNVAVVSPDNPARMVLVDGQRTAGLEVGFAGEVAANWHVLAAYAYQQGTITTTQSAILRAGAALGQLPRHSASIWNRYDMSPRAGFGLGVVHRGDMFVAADNTVTLPAFTRVDGALFLHVARQLRAQVNVENVLDRLYYASAHSNNNITPGSPRALRVTLVALF